MFGLVPVEATLSYLLFTEDGRSIPLKAKYELFQVEDEGRDFANKFAWIRVESHEGTDLVYPVGSGAPEADE